MNSVSIVTPTYNRAAWLRETLDSLLAQARAPLEIIVVDDGSTDATPALLAGYGDKLHTLRHSENRGEAASVNAGWRRARGDYVAIVSSDDPQPRDWLAVVAGHLDAHPGLVAAYPDWTMIDAQSRPIAPQTAPDFDYPRMLAECVCLPGPGALIRRALAPPDEIRSPLYPLAADFAAWLELGLRGPIAHVPAAAAQWRRHDGSTTEQNRGPALGRECERIMRDFFARADLPTPIAALAPRARAGAARIGAHLSVRVDRAAMLAFMTRWFWRAPGAFDWREAARLCARGMR